MTQEDELFLRERLFELLKDDRISKMNEFIQHGNVTCLQHCISVVYFSFGFCRQFHIKVDEESLIRGALLHDYFLYDWHVKDGKRKLHGFYHPILALHNANRDFDLTRKEKDIILNHMWPLTLLHMPHYKESWIVCIMDKLCSISEVFGWSLFQYAYKED